MAQITPIENKNILEPNVELVVSQTPSCSSATSKKKFVGGGLKKCFDALVNRKQVNVELDVLNLLIRKELDININEVDQEIVDILPYLLTYYIKNWPGWENSPQYFSGKIQYKTWYNEFFKYINEKLKEVINTHYHAALAELEQDKVEEIKQKFEWKKISDSETQTSILSRKDTAPFTIHITAPADLLNTIVFSNTAEGDVILKNHPPLEWEQSACDNFTLKQLITWPHVTVCLISPIFSFSRRNIHEYKRYVGFSGIPIPINDTEFIGNIKILNSRLPRTVYTLNYLKELCDDFLEAMKDVYPSRIFEVFKTVTEEFLTDIEDIDIKQKDKATMATNTSVDFNIGKKTYFRNKKLCKKNETKNIIGYSELIIPRMETGLCKISDEDSINNYLHQLSNYNKSGKKNMEQQNLPQLSFNCNYCEKLFQDGALMMTHLKNDHKMEQPMLCSQCKVSFSAIELSKIRWQHTCSGNIQK